MTSSASVAKLRRSLMFVEGVGLHAAHSVGVQCAFVLRQISRSVCETHSTPPELVPCQSALLQAFNPSGIVRASLFLNLCLTSSKLPRSTGREGPAVC